MRWLSFFVLASVLLTLQSVIAPRLELYGVRADWLLIAVVFFAMHGSAERAILQAWLVGVAADLMTLDRFGIHAVGYALAAGVVVSLREFLFVRRVATQAVVTFAAATILQAAWLVYRRVAYAPATTLGVDFGGNVIVAGLYTTIWAVPFHQGMLTFSALWGLPRDRQAASSVRRMDDARV